MTLVRVLREYSQKSGKGSRPMSSIEQAELRLWAHLRNWTSPKAAGRESRSVQERALVGPMARNRNLRRTNGALREGRMAPAEQRRKARIHSLRFIGAPQFQARAARPFTSFLGFHCAASITYNPLRCVSPRSTTRAFVYPFAPTHAFV